MRLWTTQPEVFYIKLQRDKVIHCDSAESEWLSEPEYKNAYEWMAEQMKRRIGNPLEGVKCPIWAWHTLNWKHQMPDLRGVEFRNYSGNRVCIELEIPDHDVLLSDEEMWHSVLNNWYCGDSMNDADLNAEYEWMESLSEEEQSKVKKKSWEKIFGIDPPYDNGWRRVGVYIQAAFWELRLDQVVNVRYYKGRQSKNS